MERIDFMSAIQKMKRQYWHKFKHLRGKWQLSQIEIDILLFLGNNPGHDTARDIVNLRGLPKSKVSQAVNKLTARGFLAAQTDATDQWFAHLQLCPSAKTVYEAAGKIQYDFSQALLQGISMEDWVHLQKIVEKIVSNAEEERISSSLLN